LTVWVIGDPPPWRKEPKQEPKRDSKKEEDPREPAEVGATSPPTDMNVWGKIAPFLPPAPPIDLDEDTRRAFDRAGELMIGAAEGTGEIALNIARDTVLNAATFGGYGVYKLGEALWNGYKEDGVLGAANSVNPLFHFVIAGIDTTLAAIAANRDYRALGAGGVKTLALGAAAVVAIAYGVGAVVESAGLRGGLREELQEGGAAEPHLPLLLDPPGARAASMPPCLGCTVGPCDGLLSPSCPAPQRRSPCSRPSPRSRSPTRSAPASSTRISAPWPTS
jgi:hypothetical protein